MIDGRTRLVGLIGWPVEHSLSPAMHNAAFEALGLNWRYVPLPVAPGQARTAVRGLAALGFRGANVTLPHKRAVIPAMDSVAPDAQTFGAVNTIVVEQHADGTASIAGHNTDAQGFIGALRQGGFEPRAGNSAVVVGAGGVARAVVFGLLDSGMGEVLILNRTLERAQALTSDLEGPAAHLSSGNSQEAHQVRALPLTPETLIESACAADLLVNATTVGMWPHTDRSIWPAGAPVPAHLTVFDVIYNPLETRLLRQARQSGARGMDGLEMLVQQGALAFDLWTDQATGVDEIAALMRKTLRVWENP